MKADSFCSQGADAKFTISSTTMVSFESMLVKLISFTCVSDYSIGTVITLDSHGVISNNDEAL